MNYDFSLFLPVRLIVTLRPYHTRFVLVSHVRLPWVSLSRVGDSPYLAGMPALCLRHGEDNALKVGAHLTRAASVDRPRRFARVGLTARHVSPKKCMSYVGGRPARPRKRTIKKLRVRF